MTTFIKMPSEFYSLRPHPVGGLERYGNLSDGGYVLPKEIVGMIDGLVSFGISSTFLWNSDKEFNSLFTLEIRLKLKTTY